MRYKYIIFPMTITSHYGDKHYITGEELIRLYSLNRYECIVSNFSDRNLLEIIDYKKYNIRFLIPRPSGNYSL